MRVISIQNHSSKKKFNYQINFRGTSQPKLDDNIPVNKIPDYETAQKIWRTIAEEDNIVILAHRFTDGDAIGAGLMLSDTIQRNFPEKKVQFCVPNGYPSYLKGMPNIEKITTKKPEGDIGLVIMVDTDEAYVDGLDIYKKAKKHIIIDHHEKKQITNDLSLINPKAPSTTEILYDNLFKVLGIKISPNAAEDALTGLITDTGRFRLTHHGDSALAMRDELLSNYGEKRSFSVDTIIKKFDKNAFVSKELERLIQNLKIGIRTITTDSNIKVRFKILSNVKTQKFKIKDSQPDIKGKLKLISNFMLEGYNNSSTSSKTKIRKFKLKNDSNISDLATKRDISVIFWELGNNEVKVMMQSNGIDICKFVSNYKGGGGHPHAAGFSTYGHIADVVNKILSEIKKFPFK